MKSSRFLFIVNEDKIVDPIWGCACSSTQSFFDLTFVRCHALSIVVQRA